MMISAIQSTEPLMLTGLEPEGQGLYLQPARIIFEIIIMNTETATSMSATHPAVIKMQANSTVFHQSVSNSAIFLQSIQLETLVFLK